MKNSFKLHQPLIGIIVKIPKNYKNINSSTVRGTDNKTGEGVTIITIKFYQDIDNTDIPSVEYILNELSTVDYCEAEALITK